MPAPLGKHREVEGARAPWNIPQEPVRKVQVTRAKQEEIDICLECKALDCSHGDCGIIRSFDKGPRRVAKIPKNFGRDAQTPGMTYPKLMKKYKVSKYMVNRWKRELGLTR